MNSRELKMNFKKVYQADPDVLYFSPGRVNLLGEHTDYNGGYVFPCAISLGTWGAIRKRDDRQLKFFSGNCEKEGIITSDLDHLEYTPEAKWTNYAKGIIHYFKQNGYKIDAGMDIYIWGNLPQGGSGLSSSASIEMLFCGMIEELFGYQLDDLKAIKMGVDTENKYLGLNSGILDQFIIRKGKKDHAILLNTADLHYEYVPVDLGDNALVIMNTNKPRALVDSKYNERVKECNEALAVFQKDMKINSLSEVTEADLIKHMSELDSRHLQRVRHIVFENQCCLLGKEALDNDNLQEFGRIQNASHVSLQYDYEVSGIELDTLVHAAWKQPGVLGARMCGAGFGGSGIALVAKDKVNEFEKNVGKIYEEKIGYAPRFYTVEIVDGAHRLREED